MDDSTSTVKQSFQNLVEASLTSKIERNQPEIDLNLSCQKGIKLINIQIVLFRSHQRKTV